MNIKKSHLKTTLILILFFITGFIYEPDPSFDLYRYYEFYDDINTSQSIIEFIESTHNTNFDFIYFLFFYIAKILSIDKRFVNGFFISLYYFFGYAFIAKYNKSQTNFNSQSSNRIIYYIIFITPIVYTLSISRTIASLTLLLISLQMQTMGRKLLALIFILLALLTHVGMTIYIAPISIIFYINKNPEWRSRQKIFYAMTIFICLISPLWIDILLRSLGNLYFFEKFTRYTSYLDASTNIFNDLAYYDYLIAVYMLAAGLFVLLLLSNHNQYTTSAGYILLIYAASINYSTMLTQRTMMILPPFLGIILLEASKQMRGSNFRHLPKIIALVGILFFFVNLFGYRAYLLNSFF